MSIKWTMDIIPGNPGMYAFPREKLKPANVVLYVMLLLMLVVM